MTKEYKCDICGESKDKRLMDEFTEVIKAEDESSGECRRTFWVCKEEHKEEE